MVDFRIQVEPSSRDRVGWINEKHHVGSVSIVADEFNAIALDKRNARSFPRYVCYPFAERLDIPPRCDPAPILAFFHETCTWSHDAAALDPIANKRSKGSVE